MKQIQKIEGGYYSYKELLIPNDSRNKDYQKMQQDIQKGEAEVLPLNVATEEAVNIVKAKNDAEQYLRETDWYVIRKAETGKDIPVQISLNREEARVLANKN